MNFKGFSFRDYTKILRRRKWYFIVPFTLVLALGILKVVTSKPVYESSAVVQIESGQLLGKQLERVVPGIGPTRDSYQTSIIRTRILSTETLTRIIYQLELNKEEKIILRAAEKQFAYPEKKLDSIIETLLIEQLRKRVSIRSHGSGMLEISVESSSPDKAYMITKALTDLFIEQSLSSELLTIQSAINFGQEQLDTYRGKLELVEKRLEDYKKGLVAKELENGNLDHENLNQVKEAVAAIDIAMKEKQDYLDSVNSQNGIPLASLTGLTPKIKALNARIEERIAHMAVLMRSHSSNSTEVIGVNRSINLLRDNVANELNSYHQSKSAKSDPRNVTQLVRISTAQFDLSILTRKKQALKDLIDKYRVQNSSNVAEDLTLEKLQKEVNITRDIYNLFLQQSQGNQIQESMQRALAASRFSIIEPPTRPLEPVSAGYQLILLMSLFLGSSLGGALVYLREQADPSIRSVQDAEDFFQIPVIGVLPYMAEVNTNPQKKRNIAIGLAASGIVLIFVAAIFIYVKQIAN